MRTKLIVGLGNPGSRYAKTRHNIGRRIIETWGRESKVEWKQSKALGCHWARFEDDKTSVLLAFPDTFMNESGSAVSLLVGHHRINFKEDLLIVADDAALPFGRLRLRAKGSDGGHRGLRSVEAALQSPHYARLRVGIAPKDPTEVPLETYVLSPFDAAENEKLKDVMERGIEACQRWVRGPVERAMDRTNKPA